MSPHSAQILKQQIEEAEGFRAACYLDSEGFKTIGIGRLIDAKKGGGISKAEALYLLDNDLARVQQELDAAMSSLSTDENGDGNAKSGEPGWGTHSIPLQRR